MTMLHNHRHVCVHTNTHRDTETHRDTDTHGDTETHRDTRRHTETQTHTETHRDTRRHRDTHWLLGPQQPSLQGAGVTPPLPTGASLQC